MQPTWISSSPLLPVQPSVLGRACKTFDGQRTYGEYGLPQLRQSPISTCLTEIFRHWWNYVKTDRVIPLRGGPVAFTLTRLSVEARYCTFFTPQSPPWQPRRFGVIINELVIYLLIKERAHNKNEYKEEAIQSAGC